MNDIARYAFKALDTAMAATGKLPPANQHGEIPGNGPEYACARYGAVDHDYTKCTDCWDGFCRHCDARTGVA